MVRNNNHGVELADIVNLNSIAPVCVCIYIKYLWTWTEPKLGVREQKKNYYKTPNKHSYIYIYIQTEPEFGVRGQEKIYYKTPNKHSYIYIYINSQN